MTRTRALACLRAVALVALSAASAIGQDRPDLTVADFEEALAAYESRVRRFGRR